MARADHRSGPSSGVRAVLEEVAARGSTITYRELGTALGLTPPGVIRRVAVLLERLMEEDAAARRPFLAAVVVSRSGDLPRRGFFEKARALGRYAGDVAGPEARRFHESEYRAAIGSHRRD